MKTPTQPDGAMKLQTTTQDGRNISELTPRVPVSAEKDIETASFQVVTTRGSIFLVDFYFKPGCAPHGWEATQPETTNDSGYHSTGGLRFAGRTLEDMDGVHFLPNCVAAVLRAAGFGVSNDFLNAPQI